MCGIAGIMRIAPIVSPEVAIPERWLDALDAPITARGPDGRGRWRTRAAGPSGSVTHVALVHRRMAIIDPAGGAQPMVLDARGQGSGQVAVTFNGCIYNHRELREELRGLGHRFQTDHSDTEVLLHGHRQWGRALHERLEGMYGAGIWDESERSLVLMRDMMGEKPLYFAPVRLSGDGEAGDGSAYEGVIVFASSASAVFAALRAIGREPGMERAIVTSLEVDPGAMRRWIAFGWDEGTPWSGIRELKPGQVAWFDSLGRSGRRRLSVEAESRGSLGLDAASAWAMIQHSVERRLEADVPLGCFLSGGIDSGLIAAAAQRSLAKRGERLKTYTMRMPDAAYDESTLAAMTAAHLGTDHTTLDVAGADGTEAAGDARELIKWMGLPLGDSSLLPTFWLSRAVRGQVKVALSGDGGDELFAGYERHVAAAWLGRGRALWRMLGVLPWREGNAKSFSSKMARLCGAARGAGYADLVAMYSTRMQRGLMGAASERVAFESPRSPHRRDLETYLPGDLLRKVDTASMRVALEVRAPMLDRELVYRAMATRREALMRGGRKGMLRAAARGVLPEAVARARKSGFAIPIGVWFKGPGALREMLHDTVRAADAFEGIGVEIERGFVEKMLREHDAGSRDHAQRLYGLMVVSVWNGWRRGERSGTV
jgi:asparagine synthase (glutamine-hydrolysing)